jgi:hypothetical protein
MLRVGSYENSLGLASEWKPIFVAHYREFIVDSICVECSADPVRSTRVERNDIEAAGRPATLAEALEQEQIGCATQPQLLAKIDAPGCAAESAGASRADLDEDEGVAVMHHQVQLAHLVAHVAGDMHEAGGFQQAPRRLLGIQAGDLPFRGGRARRRDTPP